VAALTIWLFDQGRVDEVLGTVTRIKEHGWVDCFDAGLIEWPAGQDRPALRHLTELAGDERFPDAFWTTLYGVVFFPASLGAGLSTAGAAVTDESLGITPKLAADLRAELRPGGAALLVYSSGDFAATGEAMDQIREARVGVPVRLLTSNLDDEGLARVRDTFGT